EGGALLLAESPSGGWRPYRWMEAVPVGTGQIDSLLAHSALPAHTRRDPMSSDATAALAALPPDDTLSLVDEENQPVPPTHRTLFDVWAPRAIRDIPADQAVPP